MKTISVSLVLVAACVLAACDTPSPVAPPAPTGLRVYAPLHGDTPSDLTNARVGLDADGRELQFIARAQLTGTNEVNVTPFTQWHSSNTDVLTVDETGLVRVVGNGQAVLTATYLEHTATVTFRVGD